jgi:hypothetical protein
MELVIANYAAPAITGELLGLVGRRPHRDLRAAAEALVAVFARRDDLVRAFASEGRVQHLALLGWALDIDPDIDPDIADLQRLRPALEALRTAINARQP